MNGSSGRTVLSARELSIYLRVRMTYKESAMKLLHKFERLTEDGTEAITAQEEVTTPTKSRRTKIIQGAVAFVVMFVSLRWLLARRGREN